METSTNINQLFTEINRQLPLEQQIRKDDPLYAVVNANKVVLDHYTELLNKNLDEALRQLIISSEQQAERTANIADRLISKSGDSVEEQLDLAIQRCEDRLKQASSETQTKIQRAYWLAWAGAILVSVTACMIIGSWAGNLIFDVLVHHTASSSHHLSKKAGHKQDPYTEKSF